MPDGPEHGSHLPPPAPRPGLGVVAALLLVIFAGLALWGAVAGVGPGRVDGTLFDEIVDTRTDLLTALALVVTTIGNTVVMAALATAVGIWSWRRGRRADAVFVVGAMAGGVLLFRGLKILIDRPRPPAAVQVIAENNESLPSGHATMATVVVGSLVVLAWAGRGALGRALMATGALLWIGAVGLTRVYLGVHWFSDVVAGWLVGAAWLAVCVTIWSWWRRRASPSPAERTALSPHQAG